MASLNDLKIKIYADGADRDGILGLYKNELVKGFTTNPSLMAKAGNKDYRAFAKDILSAIKDRPFSFEVFTDDIADMERQAAEIKTWGANVYVKIPVTNTKGQSCLALVRKLTNEGVQLNVTALMTTQQVESVVDALALRPDLTSHSGRRVAPTDEVEAAAGLCLIRKRNTVYLVHSECRLAMNNHSRVCN